MESHTQTLHPKEEQHACPGGHLFSQVRSPNVIKIGAAHILSNAAPVHEHGGCQGMEDARSSCVVFRADGTDDESLTERKEPVEERRKAWGIV